MSAHKKKKAFNPFDDFTEDPFYNVRIRPREDDEPEESQEPPPPPPVWPDVLEQLLLAYQPASDRNETDTMTSAEIQTAVYNHCGQAPRKDELFSHLIERGYRYRLVNENQLHWSMKKI